MEQRLSPITLGLAEVSRAQAFYDALGWRLEEGSVTLAAGRP